MTGALFNLEQYTSSPSRPRDVDPYWDLPEEVILDSSGKVEDSGQTTLFYDSSAEPPEPDDYPTRADYLRAWIEWERKFPEQISSPPNGHWVRNYRGYRCEFFIMEKGERGTGKWKIQFTGWNDYLMLGTFHDEYDSPTQAELDFVEYIDKWHPGERRPPDPRLNPYKVVLEDSDFIEPADGDFLEDLPPKIERLRGAQRQRRSHFEEGEVYWHEGRQLNAKIIKIFKSVKKADVWWAGDIFKERIFLSELSPLPEQTPCACETTAVQETETINSENCSLVTTLPEQDNSVGEKPTVNQWVERYYVTRSGKKYWYDRYCYYQKKIKHIHIPGSDGLKEQVERAIALGKTPHEIENFIRGGFGLNGKTLDLS